MNLIHQAVFLCRNESFQIWVARNNLAWVDGTPEELARHFILRNCSINSRAELANNLEAREKFLKLKAQFERDRVKREAA